ncbi:Uncharacterised protein [Cardiobacterium hominis]|uniref:DUF3828 domain-containing protein n=1 Tax=Cardiobacterium hominis (strain ATCC 15826 / DSM 8339 / NCTC 10426 / 6573) TaxID=638300 RepID=C8N842_CARH6|nr:DUF3828 domain-containing protein [Cardiobacterium hominis]EEV89219.1 hypothetical protein HMPREF0198_0669 [Cardiobacterium hominis ATCC 15826]VEG77281.1 Uncharacterised protein [Cardiobacterium hominis]
MKKYLLLALALSAGAFAAPKESPAQIVQKLYDAYQQPSVQENTALFEDYASAELKALLAKDEQLAGDEIGCLDYDFVIQGQDYDAESIKKTLKIKALDKESVEAKFTNFDPTTVIYKFACTENQCEITDLLEEDQETHKPKSFKEGLANCLVDLEKSASAK